MNWRIEPARSAFAGFAADWDRLCVGVCREHTSIASGAIAQSLERFGDGNETLCVHRTDGAVDSALIVHSEGLGRWALFRSARVQASAPLMEDPCPLQALLHQLPGYAWQLDLQPVSPARVFRNEFIAAMRTLLSFPHRHPTLPDRNDRSDPVGVTRYFSIRELPSDALQLLAHAGATSPELAPGWFANLEATVFGADPRLGYYVARSAGKVRVVLAVRLVRHGIIRRIEALGNYYTSLYSPIFAPGAGVADLTPLLQATSQDHGDAHEMRFAPMDPASQDYATLLSALRCAGWVPFQFFCFGNWWLTIEDGWHAYFGQRPGQLRSTIRRKGQRFSAQGGTFEIVTDLTDAETAIQAFTQVYSRSWKKPEPYPNFIPGLIRWLAKEGWLRLGIAFLHAKPIAAQLWIVGNGRASIFKLAHDESHAASGVGTLLTAKLMQHVVERDGVKEVDYLIGDDAYKRDWMSTRRERWGIAAYNPHKVIGSLLWARELGGRAIRRLARQIRNATLKMD